MAHRYIKILERKDEQTNQNQPHFLAYGLCHPSIWQIKTAKDELSTAKGFDQIPHDDIPG